MEFRDSESNEIINAGDRVSITFTFPDKLTNIGREDKILKDILDKYDGKIRKEKK